MMIFLTPSHHLGSLLIAATAALQWRR